MWLVPFLFSQEKSVKLDKLIQLDETRIDKTAVLQQIAQNLATRQFTSPSFPTFQLELANLP